MQQSFGEPEEEQREVNAKIKPLETRSPKGRMVQLRNHHYCSGRSRGQFMARVEKMWQREPWSTAGGTLHRSSRPGVSADTMTSSSGHKSLQTTALLPWDVTGLSPPGPCRVRGEDVHLSMCELTRNKSLCASQKKQKGKHCYGGLKYITARRTICLYLATGLHLKNTVAGEEARSRTNHIHKTESALKCIHV